MAEFELPPFPGEEFAEKNSLTGLIEFIYEYGGVEYAETTSGQVVTLTLLEYWARIVTDEGREIGPWRAPVLIDRMTTVEQQRAIRRADVIQKMRERQDPALNTFTYLREMGVGYFA